MAEMSSAQRLAELVRKARSVRMTAVQKIEQRKSFAFGNAAFENPLITKEMIKEELEKMGSNVR